MSLLSGIRVISVEQYGAGPFATEYLASMGAEVIKVEQPDEGGDIARGVGPYFDESLPDSARSLFFHSLNTGKRSITLNLREPQGREVFRRLAKTSDAILSNLRGDVPAKLGLTYVQISDVNPKIVCCHLTGYGRGGERAHWPGYDYLMQAEAGYFDLTGEPSSPPARMGLSMVDYMTGVATSLGLVSGVLNAQRTGEGSDVDVSLFDVALHNLNYLAAWYLNAGAPTSRQPRSAHPSLVPCQLYRTADGWIYLMCNKEKFWRILCECIGQHDLIAHPDYVDFKARLQNREALTPVLDAVLSEKTTAEWMTVFAGKVPAAPVLSVAEALENDFVKNSDRIARAHGPDGQSINIVRNPIRSSKHGDELQMAPALGVDTDQILEQCGFDKEQIAQLRADGII